MALRPTELRTELHNDWCPGCGDFGILSATQMALAELDIEPHRVAIFSDIGCSGKTPHYINAYGIHTLHGRVLPFALGAKIANPGLEVIATSGDGGGFGIGAGHMVNTGRRNIDFTYIMFDNQVYGLTKGQASPTLGLDLQTKALPQPNINSAVNPIMMALAAGYTFIARSYAFDTKHLKELIKKGSLHRGSAFIDVLQPCPTYNDIHTKDWFSGIDRRDEHNRPMPRVYKLEEEGHDPTIRDPHDEKEVSEKLARIIIKSREFGDRTPIGVFFQDNQTPPYEDRIAKRLPGYLTHPPALQQISTKQGKPTTSIARMVEELRTGE